jgi:site-specific DNA recombinase
MTKKRLGIAYVRKSQKKQKDYSIPSQIAKAEKYASENNIHLTKIFHEMRSGWKRGQRIEFFKMVAFIAENKVDDLLFFTPDRISRNMYDYYCLKEAIEESNLYNEKSYLTLHKIIDRKKFRLNHEDDFEAAIDHEQEILEGDRYSQRIRKRVKIAFDEKLKRGEYPGYAPLGYFNNRLTNEIEIDPDRFDLVKKGFKLFLTGNYSINSFTKELRHLGLNTRPSGSNNGIPKPVSRGQAGRMLNDPFYYGHFRWTGKIWSNRGINNDRPPSYPPMITKAEYERIREILTGNRTNEVGYHGEIHLLRGILKCQCGRSPVWMPKTKILKSTGEKKTYHYYYCRHCSLVIRLEDIENAILRNMSLILPDENVMKALIKDLGEQFQEIQGALKNELQYLRKRHTEIGTKISSLTDKYADIQDDKDLESILIAQIKKYQEERDEIKAHIREFEDKNDESVDEVVEIVELAKDFKTKYLQSDMETRHRMLKLMYRTVEIREIEEYLLEKSPHMRFYLTHNEVFEGLFDKGLEKHAAEWTERNIQKLPDFKKWRGRRDLNSRPLA